MRHYFFLFLPVYFTVIYGCTTKTEFLVKSPDETIIAEVNIRAADPSSGNQHRLFLSVHSNDQNIIKAASFGLEFKNMKPFGAGVKVVEEKFTSINESWTRVWGRSKDVINNYNELVLTLQETQAPERTLDLYFRVYNDGAAFRYGIPEQEGLTSIEITKEQTYLSFNDDHEVWATTFAGDQSHQENEFIQKKLSEVTPSHLPLIVKIAENNWIALTEANLADWSGMHFVNDPDKANTLNIIMAPRKDDPEISVKSNAPALSPWRTIMIGDSPGSFLESDIIQNLNEPCAIEDVSWIKPGKSAWDWWWCNRYAPDVDFELGSNTETMKYFIDFASDMGWEYQLVDWHWYGDPFTPEFDPVTDADITQQNPEIDIPGLVEYAKSKNVKLLLWLEWTHANKQMEEAFPLYEKWGIAGVKIDFMASEHQEMVDFYHRAVKLAAIHHLVVDFHGAYKPTGFSRTYPNLMTREGVMGNEYTKWSDNVTPEHTVTLAFTRGILGEMDFTPGAFVNVTKDNFKLEDDSPTPMTMGTRCNQLAMMVVYESALQVLCDAPYNYRNSPQGLEFLKIVPTTWDETRVLNEEIGNYIVVARRSGEEWFVGSMTDWDERQLDISLGILGNGKFKCTIWKDALNANEHPVNLEKEEIEVDRSKTIKARLSKGGGHVMHITPM